jgi:hypothetical protein
MNHGKKTKNKKRQKEIQHVKKNKGMENFYVPCLHKGVQFVGAKTRIHICLFPCLLALAKFFQPCDTFMHIHLGNFDKA